MKTYSKTAWEIASRYSSVLASETRDLAAAIDGVIEACAKIADDHVGAGYSSPTDAPNEIYNEACRDIAKAIRDIYPNE